MASQLFEQLRTDLNTAMKDRDQLKTSTIRMVLSAVQVASVAGDEAAELTDAEITAVLRSEAKRRNEAAELYENAGRAEQAASERNELAVIESYLPAAMDDGTLQGIVDEEIAVAREAGAEGPKAMGQIIKAVKDRVGDGADGGRIAGVVKASLA
ncbi:MAG TPA: glutamyl-tRNA amidotransferase [Acidimicrobiaceae bacterium]|nr:glutamyl-tRNA amidotransferase [Actinomycetota bacterium]HAZ33929.1 glutamyl-tRNA amidotransferase [Acidimicrobiaceae bacterium]